MFKPPKCATTFFKNLRSILVGHFGLQSVSYRVETPCISHDHDRKVSGLYFASRKSYPENLNKIYACICIRL